MELEDIKLLIDAADRLAVSALEARKGGVTLRLIRGEQPAVAAQPPAFLVPETGQRTTPVFAQADLIAPLSGVLHLSPAPEAPAFVSPGQAVKRGETLCIIEAMKVFSRVSAERDGIVEAVLFETGVEVEAGQILMQIA